jgi:hypothetical protein
MRNWADPFAARVAQVLWYYRLVGVVAFELTHVRALLLIFPNTFEYFFIAYEVVRVAWDPGRLRPKVVVGMAAFIWVFVKLPQEWWIHIAQLDFTDFMKEDVLGVTPDSSWGDAFAESPWFLPVLGVAVVAVAFGAYRVLRAAPPTDWPASVDVDRHPQSTRVGVSPAPVRVVEWDLVEKCLLLSLVAIIFAQVIPNTDATPLQLTFTVSVIVVANAAVSTALTRRGHSWRSTATQFAGTAAINAVLVVVYYTFFRRTDVDEGAAIFFLLLLTLLTTLYDRYRPLRAAGYPAIGAAA